MLFLGTLFSRENNTHGSRFHERDPQFASRILGAMTQSCYIGTRDIRSRVIRGPYCIFISKNSDKYKLTRALILNERRIARLSKFIFYNIQNYFAFKPEI